MNFFVGVRLCNLVNETAPLPQFCVIFLNISLFQEMMLEKKHENLRYQENSLFDS